MPIEKLQRTSQTQATHRTMTLSCQSRPATVKLTRRQWSLYRHHAHVLILWQSVTQTGRWMRLSHSMSTFPATPILPIRFLRIQTRLSNNRARDVITRVQK